MAEYFRSARTMANAEELAWREIEGIGRKIAERSVWEIKRRI